MRTHRSRRATCGLWLAGAVACSTIVVNPTPAAATWANSDVSALEFRDVCRDGIRFGGALTGTRDPNASPFRGVALAVQPVPDSWGTWVRGVGQVMRTSIQIPVAPPGATIDLGNAEPTLVSHIGSFTLPYQSRQVRVQEPIALNLKDGDENTIVNTADVTDCFLYAPIDIQPGASPNRVPIGRGRVSVAVLTTDAMSASALAPATFRFGPRRARAQDSSLRDVNADRRRDLVLRFGSVASGLRCSTRTVKLTGHSPSGGKLEASGRVVPTGC